MSSDEAYKHYAMMLDAVRPTVIALAANELKRFGWEVEDCLQEAALKVWAMMHSGVPRTEAYVKQAVRNHLRDCARGTRRHTVPAENDLEADTLPMAEEEYIRGWTKTEWFDMLHSAPRTIGEYLHLRVGQGFSAKEAMGIVLPTAREDWGAFEGNVAEWLIKQIEGRKNG